MLSTTTSQDFPKNPFQIKQDDKFFSRLLSKENSTANPSFRVYYGGVSVAVPFMWESEPGTPKHTLCESTLPPLTPPPSFYSNFDIKKRTKKHSRSNLLQKLFSRIYIKTTNNMSTVASSTSTLSFTPSYSSWSWSNSFSSILPSRKWRFSSRGSSFDSKIFYDEASAIESPTSTLCFGLGRATNGGLRGRYGGW